MQEDKVENWNRKLEALATIYAEHPLLSELEAMLERYNKLERRLWKVVLISDRLQNEMIELNQSLENMALSDSLTTLLNRHGMNLRLQVEWNRMKREGVPFGLMLIDIDHFKRINDTFGHAVGDRVLTELAKRLKTMTRSSDACCRWGGEEFLVLLPNTDRQGIEMVYQKLRDSLCDDPIRQENSQPIGLTFSAGAHIALADNTPDESITRADNALYRAKRNGRNGLQWSSSARTAQKEEGKSRCAE
ncbi:MAG: GGDEF domain-containing protein [Rhodocyclaceae bacterium]